MGTSATLKYEIFDSCLSCGNKGSQFWLRWAFIPEIRGHSFDSDERSFRICLFTVLTLMSVHFGNKSSLFCGTRCSATKFFWGGSGGLKIRYSTAFQKWLISVYNDPTRPSHYLTQALFDSSPSNSQLQIDSDWRCVFILIVAWDLRVSIRTMPRKTASPSP